MSAANRLQLVPMSIKRANDFVSQHHRHHGDHYSQRTPLAFAVGTSVSDG
jgi:hypothetical protein